MPRRPIAPLAMVLVTTLCLVPGVKAQAESDREPPPERMARERLMRLAAASGDHAPLGPVRRPGLLAGPRLNWESLGPEPIDYDYWATGRAAGRVSSIVVDPRDPDVVYLAAAQGGVWKTTDGGITWTPLTDQLSSLASGALALHPVYPDVVFYGTGEQHQSGDSFYGDGLFESTDGGASWFKLATASQVGSYIARVAVNPADPETMYVAGSSGFVRSLDGGVTWTTTLADGWCFDIAQHPTDPSVLYATVAAAGIYRSDDAGASWTPLAGGLPTTSFDRPQVAIAPSNSNVLYASYADLNGLLLGVYLSQDGGDSWTRLSSAPDYLDGQGWYDQCLIVAPDTADVCFAGGVYPYSENYAGVVRTLDRGATWSDVTFGVDGVAVHPDQHTFAWGPDGTLWIGNDGGVWKTYDRGLHWINCNGNLNITQFYSAAVHPIDHNRILGGTQDNGTLIYEGAPIWPQVIAGDGGYCLFLANDPATYFTTYVYLNPVYEWHSGSFVAERTGPWGGAGDRASFALGPLVGDPNTANTLLAGTYRVWRSGNRGASWNLLSGDIAPDGDVLRALTVADRAPNTIYAGSFNGRLYVTSNASMWLPRSAGLPFGAIDDIAVSPGDPLTAYICSDNVGQGRVWRTANAGVSWTDASGDLPANLRGLCLAVDFGADPPLLYLGTDYGIFSSDDGGAHWIKEDQGLPSLAVFDLKLDFGGHQLVAATHGRGMWRGTIGTLAAAESPSRPNALALRAMNPTRAPATVEYRLPSAANVSLEVYDAAGRRVRVIDRGARAAGDHRTTWDGRAENGAPATSGVYFVRLAVENGTKGLKLALLR